jgi:FAD/FMN-containing dehydrogenase
MKIDSRNKLTFRYYIGALQDWIWEGGSTADEACHVKTPTAAPCHQGRIPIYSAAVKSPRHVQKAVEFAHQHNLRLVIRNTGHDGAGRSSSPDSFQIHTHSMNEIKYHNNFHTGSSDIPLGPAVTVGAGVMLGDLYEKGAHEGWVIIGGECPTVGVAGGFVQGGGVSSFLSYTAGLAVDNVIEFEVVSAKVGIYPILS